MNTYETSATVEDQGQVHVAGVPFAPGTEVAITISPKRRSDQKGTPPDEEVLAASRERMRALFSTIKGYRNSPRTLRDEIYYRGQR
jgi:hypothetical protein